MNETEQQIYNIVLDAKFRNNSEKEILKVSSYPTIDKTDIEKCLNKSGLSIENAPYNLFPELFSKRPEVALAVYKKFSANIFPKYKVTVTEDTYSMRKGGGQRTRVLITNVSEQEAKDYVVFNYGVRKTNYSRPTGMIASSIKIINQSTKEVLPF